MRPPDSEHAPVDQKRCAQCGMGPGRQRSGQDLGDLQIHPLDASVRADRARFVHAGCRAASMVARGTTDPLGPVPFARGGESVVHVFEAYGYGTNGSDPRARTVRMPRLRARCGFEAPAADEGDRIEWTVYAAGHPSACLGCTTPHDPSAQAFPARFPVSGRRS